MVFVTVLKELQFLGVLDVFSNQKGNGLVSGYSAPLFKDGQKLLHDQSPVFDGHTPVFFDVHDCQVNSFFSCLVIRELHFSLRVFSYSPIQVFNGVGGIDDLSDLKGKVKVVSEVFPVGAPRLDGMAVLALPFGAKSVKSL
jgi:hypothetical protein